MDHRLIFGRTGLIGSIVASCVAMCLVVMPSLGQVSSARAAGSVETVAGLDLNLNSPVSPSD